MKRLVMGILAHVDAGKTTLSEALLYHCGVIPRPGRVDRGDSVLDSADVERQRGITVFSKQAAVELVKFLRYGRPSLPIFEVYSHLDKQQVVLNEVRRILDEA